MTTTPNTIEIITDENGWAIDPTFELGTVVLDDEGEESVVAIRADRYRSGTLALFAYIRDEKGEFMDLYDEITTAVNGPLFVLSPRYDVVVSDKCSRGTYEWLIDAGFIKPEPYTQTRRYPGADLSYIHQLTDAGCDFVDAAERAAAFNRAKASLAE